jgi:hypothetical protein
MYERNNLMIWKILGIVFAAGAVGGVINALLTDNGFIRPKNAVAGDTTIWRPGAVGNLLVGATAAVISWGLYGPFANAVIAPLAATPAATPEPTLTVAAFVGAILVGISGARWLTNEVDKKLLKATASAVASAKAAPETAVELMTARPARALEIAQRLNL